MPPQNQQGPNDNLFDLRKTLNMGVWAVDVMAEGYRTPFYNAFSRGARAVGMPSVIASLFVFALFVEFNPPLSPEGTLLAAYAWQALILMTFAHAIIARRPGNRAHLQEIGGPWFGAVGDYVLAPLAALLAWPLCPGVTAFIACGWAADKVQIAMIRARYRLMVKGMEDAAEEGRIVQSYRGR